VSIGRCTPRLSRLTRRSGSVRRRYAKRVLQSQIDVEYTPGVTTAEQQRIEQLERENRDLKEANEILTAASSFFARDSTPATVDLFVHRSDACTKIPGRVDLPRDHRARCGSRRTHVQELEGGRAVGPHLHHILFYCAVAFARCIYCPFDSRLTGSDTRIRPPAGNVARGGLAKN
jgi:hypothetical protein